MEGHKVIDALREAGFEADDELYVPHAHDLGKWNLEKANEIAARFTKPAGDAESTLKGAMRTADAKEVPFGELDMPQQYGLLVNPLEEIDQLDNELDPLMHPAQGRTNTIPLTEGGRLFTLVRSQLRFIRENLEPRLGESQVVETIQAKQKTDDFTATTLFSLDRDGVVSKVIGCISTAGGRTEERTLDVVRISRDRDGVISVTRQRGLK